MMKATGCERDGARVPARVGTSRKLLAVVCAISLSFAAAPAQAGWRGNGAAMGIIAIGAMAIAAEQSRKAGKKAGMAAPRRQAVSKATSSKRPKKDVAVAREMPAAGAEPVKTLPAGVEPEASVGTPTGARVVPLAAGTAAASVAATSQSPATSPSRLPDLPVEGVPGPVE